MLRYKLKKQSDGSVKIEKKTKDNSNPLVTGELNLFDLGTLCHFESHAWRAVVKLPKEVSAKISKQKQENWYRATKNLIDRSHLTEVYSIITQARNLILAYATPFPMESIHFIAAGNVEVVNNGLKELDKKLSEAVAKFNLDYPKYKREARQILEPDGLWNKAEYPDNVSDKFSIHWRFFDLSIPAQLSDELKKQEQAQFNSLMEETKNLGVHALRKAFMEIVADLHDTLSGKLDGEKKRLNQGKLDKVAEFFNTFKMKNVFHDAELEKVIVDAQSMVEGIEYTDLNKDKELSGMMVEEMAKIKGQLEGMVETYERKISFD
jgi:hypothetical protein